MRWPPASGGGAAPTSLAELATRRSPSGFILPEPPMPADQSPAGSEPTRAGVRNGPTSTPPPAQGGMKTLEPKSGSPGQPESHPGAFPYQGEALSYAGDATSGQAAQALGKRKPPPARGETPGSFSSPDA